MFDWFILTFAIDAWLRSCFKCSSCSESPLPDSQGTLQLPLLRSKVDALLRGEYFCSKCAPQTTAPKGYPKVRLAVSFEVIHFFPSYTVEFCGPIFGMFRQHTSTYYPIITIILYYRSNRAGRGAVAGLDIARCVSTLFLQGLYGTFVHGTSFPVIWS